MDQRGRPISPAVLSAAEEVRRRAIHPYQLRDSEIKTLTDASPEKPKPAFICTGFLKTKHDCALDSTIPTSCWSYSPYDFA